MTRDNNGQRTDDDRHLPCHLLHFDLERCRALSHLLQCRRDLPHFGSHAGVHGDRHTRAVCDVG